MLRLFHTYNTLKILKIHNYISNMACTTRIIGIKYTVHHPYSYISCIFYTHSNKYFPLKYFLGVTILFIFIRVDDVGKSFPFFFTPQRIVHYNITNNGFEKKYRCENKKKIIRVSRGGWWFIVYVWYAFVGITALMIVINVIIINNI